MEDLLKNDHFMQYIVNEYLTASNMTAQEKIQTVFSSEEDFTKAMNCYELSNDTIAKH